MEDAKAARAALRVLTKLSERQLMDLADALDDDVPASLKLLSLLGAAASERWPELDEPGGSRPRRVPVSPAKASTPTSPTKRVSPAAARQAAEDLGAAAGAVVAPFPPQPLQPLLERPLALQPLRVSLRALRAGLAAGAAAEERAGSAAEPTASWFCDAAPEA